MTRNLRRIRGLWPLVLQVEHLEDRRLLSGSGLGRRLSEPPPPFLGDPPASEVGEGAVVRGHRPKADVLPPGQAGGSGSSGAVAVARDGPGSVAEARPQAESTGPGQENGRGRSVGKGGVPNPAGGTSEGLPKSVGAAPEAGASDAGDLPAGRAAKAATKAATNGKSAGREGSAAGLEVASGQVLSSPGQGNGGTKSLTSGPGNGRPDRADTSSRPVPAEKGGTSVASGSGANLDGSSAADTTRERPPLAALERPASEFDKGESEETAAPPASSRSRSDRPDDDTLGSLLVPMTILVGLTPTGRLAAYQAGNHVPSQAERTDTRPTVATQGVPDVYAYGSVVGSDSVIFQIIPGRGGVLVAQALRSAGAWDVLSPEESDLGADPANSPAEALLGELRDLLGGLRAAGEEALGLLGGRELSEWLLLALVVIVVVDVARRELWNAEVRSLEDELERALIPRPA